MQVSRPRSAGDAISNVEFSGVPVSRSQQWPASANYAAPIIHVNISTIDYASDHPLRNVDGRDVGNEERAVALPSNNTVTKIAQVMIDMPVVPLIYLTSRSRPCPQ